MFALPTLAGAPGSHGRWGHSLVQCRSLPNTNAFHTSSHASQPFRTAVFILALSPSRRLFFFFAALPPSSTPSHVISSIRTLPPTPSIYRRAALGPLFACSPMTQNPPLADPCQNPSQTKDSKKKRAPSLLAFLSVIPAAQTTNHNRCRDCDGGRGSLLALLSHRLLRRMCASSSLSTTF